MNWKDASDAEIRHLFEVEKLSYRKIANRFVDATLGMVAGRCRKLGLVRGTSKTLGHRKVAGAMEPPDRPVVVITAPKPRAEPAQPGTVKLLDLDAQACRWPFGSPSDPDFGFCGMTKVEGSSYCADHHAKSRTKGWSKQ